MCLCKICSVYLILQNRFIVPSYPNTDLNGDAKHYPLSSTTSECLSAAYLRKETTENSSSLNYQTINHQNQNIKAIFGGFCHFYLEDGGELTGKRRDEPRNDPSQTQTLGEQIAKLY